MLNRWTESRFLTAGALLTALALAPGCGDSSNQMSASDSAATQSSTDSASGTQSASSTGATTSAGATSDAATTGTDDPTSTTGTGPNPNIDCDPGKQDCPDGEKCTPYVKEENACCVDATHCVPDSGAKQFGDDCVRMNDTDDCAKGLFCHGPTSGSEGDGVCVVLCDVDNPATCDGTCYGWNDGALPLCDVECDPLVQDCPNKHGCYPILSAGIFVCIVEGYDEAGGNDGDPCEVVQGCKPGLACESSDVLVGCPGTDCCTPICDITDPDPCAEAMEQCVSVWPADDIPPQYANVGYCVVPE
ncbi:MAG: hypothetical protein H6713_14225 [Myxococcales bacterium]|nr:hypothetical protein [Myxococcales bacterium]MCB9751130.1 hypothetical protein [Myxococcales bacterium]